MALIIIGCIKVGGVSRVVEINDEWGRFDISLSGDPTTRLTLWSSLFGGMFLGLGMLGANQPCMQRTCSLRDLRAARWSVVLGGIIMCVFIYLSTIVGCVIFAYYTSFGCDPVQSNQVSSENQILPYYIMDVLAYPGLPGLLFSSLFSGSLSSLSSSINSMSAVTWKDILEPYCKHWSEERKTHCNKIMTFIYGLTCLASSFVMMFVGGSLVAIAASVLGAVLGPLLGVFFMAVLIPFCNWKGALFGGIFSATVNIWMLFGMVATQTQVTRLPAPTYGCSVQDEALFNGTSTMMLPTTGTTLFANVTTVETEPLASDGGFLHWLYSVSFIWYPLIGVLLSMATGIPVSLLTGPTKLKDVEPKLVASYVYECCVPEDAKRRDEYKPVELRKKPDLPDGEDWTRKEVVSSL